MAYGLAETCGCRTASPIPFPFSFIAPLLHPTPCPLHEILPCQVTNVREAIRWLSYTYLYTRMRKNPLPYGVSWEELMADPTLEAARRRLVGEAARELQRCRMARYDEAGGNLHVTDLGRVASHYYIAASSIEVFNERLRARLGEADVLAMMARSKGGLGWLCLVVGGVEGGGRRGQRCLAMEYQGREVEGHGNRHLGEEGRRSAGVLSSAFHVWHGPAGILYQTSHPLHTPCLALHTPSLHLEFHLMTYTPCQSLTI